MAAGDQLEVVQDGSRWLHGPPTAEQVKAWFGTQPLHPGMDHEDYVSGIIVLPQTEEITVSKEKQNGDTYTAKVERAVYVPYVNVSTRVRYFQDYVRHLNAEREGTDLPPVIGLLRPVPQARIKSLTNTYYNENLPEGASVHAIKNGNGSVKRFLMATWEAVITERQSYRDRVNGGEPEIILIGQGTKQVPTNYRGESAWADEACIMKAETGAIGRALGVAGILVIGTGVATAEDVQEAIAGGGNVPDAPAAPEAPLSPEQAAPQALGGSGAEAAPEADPAKEDERLRDMALTLQQEMEADHPKAWEAFKVWWNEDRKFGPLSGLSGPALRGAVTKLQRDLDAAKHAPKAEAPPEEQAAVEEKPDAVKAEPEPPAPAEPPEEA